MRVRTLRAMVLNSDYAAEGGYWFMRRWNFLADMTGNSAGLPGGEYGDYTPTRIRFDRFELTAPPGVEVYADLAVADVSDIGAAYKYNYYEPHGGAVLYAGESWPVNPVPVAYDNTGWYGASPYLAVTLELSVYSDDVGALPSWAIALEFDLTIEVLAYGEWVPLADVLSTPGEMYAYDTTGVSRPFEWQLGEDLVASGDVAIDSNEQVCFWTDLVFVQQYCEDSGGETLFGTLTVDTSESVGAARAYLSDGNWADPDFLGSLPDPGDFPPVDLRYTSVNLADLDYYTIYGIYGTELQVGNVTYGGGAFYSSTTLSGISENNNPGRFVYSFRGDAPWNQHDALLQQLFVQTDSLYVLLDARPIERDFTVTYYGADLLSNEPAGAQHYSAGVTFRGYTSVGDELVYNNSTVVVRTPDAYRYTTMGAIYYNYLDIEVRITGAASTATQYSFTANMWLRYPSPTPVIGTVENLFFYDADIFGDPGTTVPPEETRMYEPGELEVVYIPDPGVVLDDNDYPPRVGYCVRVASQTFLDRLADGDASYADLLFNTSSERWLYGTLKINGQPRGIIRIVRYGGGDG